MNSQLLVEIASEMEFYTIIKLSRVSRRFNDLLFNNQELWRRLLFEKKQVYLNTSDWKTMFNIWHREVLFRIENVKTAKIRKVNIVPCVINSLPFFEHKYVFTKPNKLVYYMDIKFFHKVKYNSFCIKYKYNENESKIEQFCNNEDQVLSFVKRPTVLSGFSIYSDSKDNIKIIVYCFDNVKNNKSSNFVEGIIPIC